MSLLLLFSYSPASGPSITYVTSPLSLGIDDTTIYISDNDDTIRLEYNDTEIHI